MHFISSIDNLLPYMLSTRDTIHYDNGKPLFHANQIIEYVTIIMSYYCQINLHLHYELYTNAVIPSNKIFPLCTMIIQMSFRYMTLV